jgi:Aldehyde oxidase and xanthine dehydrogenase, a/b hammerhead domain
MSFLTSRESHAPHGIGKSISRREDARLLTGAGQYASDFSLPGQLHAYLVRSLHAHAKIVRINVAQAIGRPGVIAVLTGGDAAATAGASLFPPADRSTRPMTAILKRRKIELPKIQVDFPVVSDVGPEPASGGYTTVPGIVKARCHRLSTPMTEKARGKLSFANTALAPVEDHVAP